MSSYSNSTPKYIPSSPFSLHAYLSKSPSNHIFLSILERSLFFLNKNWLKKISSEVKMGGGELKTGQIDKSGMWLDLWWRVLTEVPITPRLETDRNVLIEKIEKEMYQLVIVHACFSVPICVNKHLLSICAPSPHKKSDWYSIHTCPLVMAVSVVTGSQEPKESASTSPPPCLI